MCHGGIILVEILLGLGHGLIVRPRFRNCNHHCQRQIHSAHHQKLQRVVQHRGVGTRLVDGGKHLVKLSVQMLGFHIFLTGDHPVRIAADGC